MRELRKDIAKFKIRRKSRMDERRARFDFEVGVYPADETGDRNINHGNTRLPYGLCKAAGIDTEGMTPSDAWDALEGKTGIKAKDAYDKLEKDGDAKKLAKDAEKLSKKKKKKAVEPEEVAGTEEFEPKVTVAPDKPLPPLTPTTFKSTIGSLNSTSSSIQEFAKGIEKEIMPRITKGQTLSANGRKYYYNGSGFETEKGEERTKAFVAYRLASFAKKDGYGLSLTNSSSVKSSKEAEAESAKMNAAMQFRNAMMAARTTASSGDIDAMKKTATHCRLVLDELPIGSTITYTTVNDDETKGKKVSAEKVGDDQYYLSSGAKKNAYQVSRYLSKSLRSDVIPSTDASDLSLPNELMTVGGYKGAKEPTYSTAPTPSSMPHTKISSAAKSSLKSGGAIKLKRTDESKTKNLATMKNGGKTRSLWQAINAKLFKSSDVKAVENGMKRLIDENEFCMNRKGTTLKRFFESGFKNQIEVFESESKTSAHYENPDERRKASQRLFGTPLNSDADSYEKYGYLGNPWSYDGDYGSTYGDVVFVFDKDKIRNRTTYTLGDSLGPSVNRGMVAGSCGEQPSFEGWYCSKPSAKAISMLKEGAKLSQILSFTKNPYVELQYHGELTMSDVKCIVFRSEMAYKNYVTSEMQEKLDELGIEVSIK